MVQVRPGIRVLTIDCADYAAPNMSYCGSYTIDKIGSIYLKGSIDPQGGTDNLPEARNI